MTKLAIVGISGFGREVANVAQTSSVWNEIFFIDDAKPINATINGIRVIGNYNIINIECLISNDTEVGSFYHLIHWVKITSGASFQSSVSVRASIISAQHVESAPEILLNCVCK
jgi:hypothetical protein